MASVRASELFSLQGRTVLLTGASGYLGRTFARALLANGARVVAFGRSERLAPEAAGWRAEFGDGMVRTERIDMYDFNALHDAVDRVAAEECVDVLVNNAFDLSGSTGFNVPDGTLEGMTFEQWHKTLSGTYWAVLVTQRVGEEMKGRRAGSIINIGTMYAVVAPDPSLYKGTAFRNPPAYSAAKAALVAFTRYTASFWGAYGIRCNAILPGPFSNVEDVSPNAVLKDVHSSNV